MSKKISATGADQVWRYGAASATFGLTHGLFTVDFRGPITRDTLERLRLDIVLLVKEPVVVLMFLWDRALCAVTAEDLDLLTDPTKQAVLNAPAAHLVTADTHAVFSEHLQRQCLVEPAGCLRVPKLTWDEAYAFGIQQIVCAENKGRRFTARIRKGS